MTKMKEWQKGEIEFVCNKCSKTVAKEQGYIRQINKVKLFIACNGCKSN